MMPTAPQLWGFFWGGLRMLWGCTCIWRWLEPPGLFSVGGGGLCSSCTG